MPLRPVSAYAGEKYRRRRDQWRTSDCAAIYKVYLPSTTGTPAHLFWLGVWGQNITQ